MGYRIVDRWLIRIIIAFVIPSFFRFYVPPVAQAKEYKKSMVTIGYLRACSYSPVDYKWANTKITVFDYEGYGKGNCFGMLSFGMRLSVSGAESWWRWVGLRFLYHRDSFTDQWGKKRYSQYTVAEFKAGVTGVFYDRIHLDFALGFCSIDAVSDVVVDTLRICGAYACGWLPKTSVSQILPSFWLDLGFPLSNRWIVMIEVWGNFITFDRMPIGASIGYRL